MLSPKLAPEIRALLEGMAAQNLPPLESLPPPIARQAAHGLDGLSGKPEPVARVEDRKIPGRAGEIPVRIYWPEKDGPFPGVVYLHGGGWVICDLDTHDNVCRAISKRAGAVVVSVDYRLAPEHKFPAALEDSLDATRWVAANAAALQIDPRRLVIAGDSAGGNMATVIATKSRDAKGPAIALQVLVYPVTNLNVADTPSHQEFATDHFLTRSVMEWFMEQLFTPGADRTNPDASPDFIKDLRGLPPALVITAECDPLRDEGEAYARRLQDSGVPVTLERYKGMIHPFVSFLATTPSAHRAVDQIAAAIQAIKPA
jgi:acetyl esterase/lipase